MTETKISFEIENEKVCKKIENYIRNYVEESNTNGVVIGLSGGIDSSVTAALAVRALGNDKVLGLILPNAALDPSYEDDAIILAKQLGIKIKKISIEEFVTAFKKSVDKDVAKSKLVLGNAMARFRMVLLYAYANHLGYLVIGTSNKTEIMVGYITKYGDGGVDFEPCGSLYKTQIRSIAKYLDIPKDIIKKPPSAGLWDGQTDEGELGITYELLDKILLAKEKGIDNQKIMSMFDVDKKELKRIEKLITSSEHKRNMPPILKL